MEHRCAQRKKTNLRVEFVTFDEVVHTGNIKDFSDLGARIITADNLPAYGSIIEVMLPDTDTRHTTAGTKRGIRGFVTWTRNRAFGLIWIAENATSLLF